jgi:hypothetical protein
MTCSFYVAGENIGAAQLKNKVASLNLAGGTQIRPIPINDTKNMFCPLMMRLTS